MYWLANDYIQRAISKGAKGLDPSKYLDKAPNMTEIFNEGLEVGQEYEIKCWGEKTIIRN